MKISWALMQKKTRTFNIALWQIVKWSKLYQNKLQLFLMPWFSPFLTKLKFSQIFLYWIGALFTFFFGWNFQFWLTHLGPFSSAVLTFIGYKQTNTQTSKVYMHIEDKTNSLGKLQIRPDLNSICTILKFIDRYDVTCSSWQIT